MSHYVCTSPICPQEEHSGECLPYTTSWDDGQ